MLQLHFLSSSSPVITQYTVKHCPNPCFSSKPFSFSHALKPSSSSFSLNPPSSRRTTHSVKYRRSKFFSSAAARKSVGDLPPRIFVNHSIYKGKSALTVSPRPPEFVPLDSGAFKVYREGYVLLQFAPAVGMRQYDWSRKQVFSLSVSEMGSLISLGSRESCEFYHDPFKGKSDEGKLRKVLKVEPLPDCSGHFFNLSVQNTLVNVDETIYIPVTKAELAVFTSVFNFIMPYLLGWHAFANSIKPEDPSRMNNANPRYGGDYEWSR